MRPDPAALTDTRRNGRMRRALVIGLCAATSCAVWRHYATVEAEEAARQFEAAESLQRRQDVECRTNRPLALCGLRISFASGPDSFAFAVPVFPGIAAVYSGWRAGPLWGQGNLRIAVWYGLGVSELATLDLWKA
jgi:hypothetical protein